MYYWRARVCVCVFARVHYGICVEVRGQLWVFLLTVGSTDQAQIIRLSWQAHSH